MTDPPLLLHWEQHAKLVCAPQWCAWHAAACTWQLYASYLQPNNLLEAQLHGGLLNCDVSCGGSRRTLNPESMALKIIGLGSFVRKV